MLFILGEIIITKVDSMDLIKISQDIKPFLFNSQDAKKIELFPDYLKSL